MSDILAIRYSYGSGSAEVPVSLWPEGEAP